MSEPIEPRFKAHYEQYIHPQIEAFEIARKAALASATKRGVIAVPAIIAALVLIAVLFNPDGGALVQIALFIGMGCFAWISWPVLQYKGRIKDQIFPEVFRFFGPQWRYDPNGIHGKQTDFGEVFSGGLKNSLENIKREVHASANDPTHMTTYGTMQPYMTFGILPAHDNAKTEDHLSGSYKEVPIALFECTLTSTSGTGKNRTTTTNFKGLVITLAVPKRFSGHTVVRRDRGAVGNWFGKQFSSALQSVKLEDPRFEKRYEVYGSDQVEARYLLTNSFMERLIELEDLFTQHAGGKACAIKCAFKDGKLMMTVPTGAEWFATSSVFTPTDFAPEINLILKEMDQLFAIIDVLKLDDKTGL